MKHVLRVGTAFLALLLGAACAQVGNDPPAVSLTSKTAPVAQASMLNAPEDWKPPVFPGAISDEEIQGSMTAVASTPQALDENASICFGFPVHDAIFYAYRTDAGVQEILDFYSQQMTAQGWKKVAAEAEEVTPPRLIWQQGATGPLVAYLMVAPMEDGRTLIYLAIAESESPQEIMEE